MASGVKFEPVTVMVRLGLPSGAVFGLRLVSVAWGNRRVSKDSTIGRNAWRGAATRRPLGGDIFIVLMRPFAGTMRETNGSERSRF
jgi:hypothetical protein